MKQLLISFSFLIALVMVTDCFAGDTDTTFTISGVITNYKPGKHIYLALYASQEDFNTRNFTDKAWLKKDELPPDSIQYTFSGVKTGYYIIAGYQDCNDDGKLNIGMFGPTEPFRIYKPRYGMFRPKFSKCKFFVNSDIDTAHMALK